MSAILTSNGLFWWDASPLPDKRFAPDDAVVGTIVITEGGIAELELDGGLSGDSGFGDAGREIADIRGLLKTDGQTVILRSAVTNGGTFHSQNVSTSRYLAFETLVARQQIKGPLISDCAEKMILSLVGLEPWTCSGAIELERSDNQADARFRKPNDYHYNTSDLCLTLSHFLESTFPHKNAHHISMTSKLYFEYKPTKPVTPQLFQNVYRALTDFLTLLIGGAIVLEWPSIVCEGDSMMTYYFAQDRMHSVTVSKNDCWVRYRDVKDRFGPLFITWMTAREQFGSAFYLFLGYKRMKSMYAEHQFVNMAWAIEAFSRVLNLDADDDKLRKRIERLVNDASDPKDKKWLRKRLRNAAEPILEQRIMTVLSGLPFDIDARKLSSFASTCAGLRNDISHYGGPRTQGGVSYQEFLSKLRDHIAALDALYHCRILKQIGIEDDAVRLGALTGVRSIYVKHSLAKAGLLGQPPDTPKTLTH